MQRKIWKTPAAGNIKNLTLCQEEIPEVEDNKVRIAVKAVGLNFADIFALTGLYSATPQGSFTPGLEYSGEIAAIGKNTTGFAVGDKVFGVTRFGGYSTVVDIEPDYCQKLPEQWNFSHGAAYVAQTLTAWYALKTLGAVRSGQNVLVQSAAGGVGLQALKICKALNVQTIGTVGNEQKKQFLAKLGFDQIIVRGQDLENQLAKILGGRPLHLALDAIGGDVQKICYRLLAATGRLIVFGAAQYTPGQKRPRYINSLIKYLKRPLYDPLEMVSSNKSVMGFNLIWLWNEKELFPSMLEEIAALELEPPIIGKEFGFDQALQAVEFLRSGQSTGKVILLV